MDGQQLLDESAIESVLDTLEEFGTILYRADVATVDQQLYRTKSSSGASDIKILIKDNTLEVFVTEGGCRFHGKTLNKQLIDIAKYITKSTTTDT